MGYTRTRRVVFRNGFSPRQRVARAKRERLRERRKGFEGI